MSPITNTDTVNNHSIEAKGSDILTNALPTNIRLINIFY